MEPEVVTDIATLERLYGEPIPTSILKEVDHIHAVYRPFIEMAPFVTLATAGPGGLDVSPRGDPAGFVHIEDDRTLLLPDRPGNNRIDGLRNILADPRIALLFFVPGVADTLRVNGRAEIVVAPALLARFAIGGKLPRSVLRIHVETVFFQCSKALVRSGLWDSARHVERSRLPSAGAILEATSRGRVDARAHDQAMPARQQSTLY